MDIVASALISKALDGLSTRQLFLAQNIANANSENYTPVEVSFEQSLRAAATEGLSAIEAVSPKIHYSSSSDSFSNTRLDLELAKASQTAMRYGALIDLLGRQMSISRLAITGGQ